ncbi:hypothetical protein D0Z00_000523 [Geotrichum galactomycetum]|uniref:Uncharacterized protein n=1 Tax=Geotrichum galactomycetum TaxID=27317 RepID=A0ACB6V9K0_9ASCO|nr:hypothetical protein D0Z00_000523 [Geotrichum candidum]
MGDDETPRVSAGPVREVVKKTTTSKKADAAPAPRAGARSHKKPAATGNEAAFRDRNAGRAANRSKPTEPASGDNKNRRAKNPRPDRHSQTGKTDSEKKVHKGWGDDKKKADDEAAGEEIAKEEAAADAAEEAAAPEEVDNSLTLEQYLEELKIKSAETETERSIRKANEGADDSKWKTSALEHKEQESFVPATKSKVLKSKAKKEKVIIDFEPVLGSPSSERSERRGGNDRGPRGGDRRNARGGNGPRGGAARGARKPAAPSQSVNISNTDEFPVLGA